VFDAGCSAKKKALVENFVAPSLALPNTWTEYFRKEKLLLQLYVFLGLRFDLF
jgi:hypothetical protein